MNSRPTWHLAHTKPRQEQAVQELLGKRGYASYFPLLRETTGNNNLILPLFPRYLFLNIAAEQDDWSNIRYTRGINSLVRVGMNPAAIPDHLVAAIRHYAETDGVHRISPNSSSQQTQTSPTDRFTADLEAIFTEQRAENRVIILLNLISKQHPIHLREERLAII